MREGVWEYNLERGREIRAGLGLELLRGFRKVAAAFRVCWGGAHNFSTSCEGLSSDGVVPIHKRMPEGSLLFP